MLGRERRMNEGFIVKKKTLYRIEIINVFIVKMYSLNRDLIGSLQKGGSMDRNPEKLIGNLQQGGLWKGTLSN